MFRFRGLGLGSFLVNRYLETTWYYSEQAREAFMHEHPDLDPSSYEDLRLVPVNTYVEESSPPTLEEY